MMGKKGNKDKVITPNRKTYLPGQGHIRNVETLKNEPVGDDSKKELTRNRIPVNSTATTANISQRTADCSKRTPEIDASSRLPAFSNTSDPSQQGQAQTESVTKALPAGSKCYHTILRFGRYKPMMELACKDDSGSVVAIRRFPGQDLQQLTEKWWSSMSGNENIPRLSHVFANGDEIVVAYDAYTVTLEHIVRATAYLDDVQLLTIMYQMINGVRGWKDADEQLRPRISLHNVWLSPEGLVKVALYEVAGQERDFLDDICTIAFFLWTKINPTERDRRHLQKMVSICKIKGRALSKQECIEAKVFQWPRLVVEFFIIILGIEHTRLDELQKWLYEQLDSNVSGGPLIRLWHRSLLACIPPYDDVKEDVHVTELLVT